MVTEMTTIRIDKATRTRLKNLAGRRPVARFLRELTQKMATGELPDVAKKLADIEAKLDALTVAVSRKDMPLADRAFIESELEKNPGARQVGYYILDKDGKWVFDEAQFLKDYEEDHK